MKESADFGETYRKTHQKFTAKAPAGDAAPAPGDGCGGLPPPVPAPGAATRGSSSSFPQIAAAVVSGGSPKHPPAERQALRAREAALRAAKRPVPGRAQLGAVAAAGASRWLSLESCCPRVPPDAPRYLLLRRPAAARRLRGREEAGRTVPAAQPGEACGKAPVSQRGAPAAGGELLAALLPRSRQRGVSCCCSAVSAGSRCLCWS